MGRMNAGWQFTAGDIPGTFNRNGLEWAFDFMDHGGIVADQGYPYFHDVSKGAAILLPCAEQLTPRCGVMYGGARGLYALANGIQIVGNGYLPRFESNISDLNFGGAGGNQNAPPALQGNGTYSIVGVYRLDAGNGGGYLWNTGTAGATSTFVGLFTSSAGVIGVDWGATYDYRYYYNSAAKLDNAKWYFVAVVVSAGTPPTAKLWVGVSGALTDFLQGITRATNGGTPPSTPNVSATPLRLGSDGSTSPSASYAGLMVYSRALSYLDCALLYQSFKAKMAERGVTVQ
jgi:hypothetical protein